MTQPSETPYFQHPRTGQRIYAPEYRAEKTPAVPQTIIVWLTPEGDSVQGITRPEVPGKRLVTTKPGEWIINGGERWQVKSVQVYR
ncbi:MAG TPA: hypothetical protein VMP01_08120 [Pirellulaceae bacterium]|nr:hypothetical protein [Pirellulaceae bacterium]